MPMTVRRPTCLTRTELRILGIDYGGRRTGLALSDPTGTIATALDPIVEAPDQARKQILRLIREREVALVVLGLPVQLSGEHHALREPITALADIIRSQTGVDVVLWDERFTSSLAVHTMVQAGVRKMKRREKERVDQISAMMILQEFLSSRQFEEWKHTRGV